MKRLFRWTVGLFIIGVVLVLAIFLCRDVITRYIVEYEIQSQTGLKAGVGRIHIGLRNPVLHIEHLVIYNTAEFGGGPFIELPELQIQYDRNALRSNKIHCTRVTLNLAQVNIVEDKKGRKNLDQLQKTVVSAVTAPVNAVPNKGSTLKPSAPWIFTGIDSLNLTLGKVTYRRLNQPGKVDELKLNVNHQAFTNLKTEDDMSAVMFVVLLRSGVNFMQAGDSQPWLQLLSPAKK